MDARSIIIDLMASGYTRNQIAKQARITAAAVSHILNGKTSTVHRQTLFGLHYYSTGASTCAAVGINYDQNGPQEATVAFAKGAWVILTMSQQSNQLRVRVNGGAWATTASLATKDMSLPMRLCEQSISGGSHDIELAHIATFNTAQTDAAISAVEHWIANDLGITPWW